MSVESRLYECLKQNECIDVRKRSSRNVYGTATKYKESRYGMLQEMGSGFIYDCD